MNTIVSKRFFSENVAEIVVADILGRGRPPCRHNLPRRRAQAENRQADYRHQG